MESKFACVDEGHDVVHVAASHKDSHQYETDRQNVRDKMRAGIGVRVVAQDATMAMVKPHDEN